MTAEPSCSASTYCSRARRKVKRREMQLQRSKRRKGGLPLSSAAQTTTSAEGAEAICAVHDTTQAASRYLWVPVAHGLSREASGGSLGLGANPGAPASSEE